ncbi:hypothetical protein [Cohaesibacter haloalkalitolerans]|uniref:hypothetical protein n=1 Tax=Cohaesibacter haloalkalitolerans TaxID=1162980 RepID=UPI000E656319|nr:hypothetical protein [Cohaesibacter haloalkalitolerans]
MKLTLIPQRRDDALALSLAGDVLTINGEALDLSGIPAGATLPRKAVGCAWLASDIERDKDGQLSLSLILPHGFIADPSTDAARAVLYPAPLEVTEDGEITLPAHEEEGIEE